MWQNSIFGKNIGRSGKPQKSQKWHQKKVVNVWVLTVHFDITHSDLPFLLEYKSINGFLTFCTNLMSGKNLVLGLQSKSLYNRGQKIEDKFTKFNKICVSLECFLAQVSKFVFCVVGCALIAIKSEHFKDFLEVS